MHFSTLYTLIYKICLVPSTIWSSHLPNQNKVGSCTELIVPTRLFSSPPTNQICRVSKQVYFVLILVQFVIGLVCMVEMVWLGIVWLKMASYGTIYLVELRLFCWVYFFSLVWFGMVSLYFKICLRSPWVTLLMLDSKFYWFPSILLN